MTLTEGLLLVIAGQLLVMMNKMLAAEDWKEVYRVGAVLLGLYLLISYWQTILAVPIILIEELFKRL
jgi:hypothetical protein